MIILFTDTWISWENYIFKGDSTREQFTFGESFRYTSSPIANFIRIEVPVQLQLKHLGGQISDYSQQIAIIYKYCCRTEGKFRPWRRKNTDRLGIEYLQFVNKCREG